jgi:hypothetical protein
MPLYCVYTYIYLYVSLWLNLNCWVCSSICRRQESKNTQYLLTQELLSKTAFLMKKQNSDCTQSDRWQCIAAVWMGVL